MNEESLREARLVRGVFDRIKVLGNGELDKKLTVEANAFSKSAKEKIEKAGGTVTVIEIPERKYVRGKNQADS